MINRLNDLTAQELNDLRARVATETRACLMCEKPHNMKVNQQFCSAKCRAKYASLAARILLERLQREKEQWQIERQELVKEIARLKEKN